MNSPSSTAASSSLQAHSRALAAIVETLGRGTVAVLGRRRAVASGTVWRAGIVVTAAHAFRRTPAAATLVAAGGAQLGASLVGIDSSTDLAVFRIVDGRSADGQAVVEETVDGADGGEGTASATLEPPRADAAMPVQAGHLVIAVGRSEEGDALASHGIVNRAGGPWQTWLGGHLDRLIRLDGGVYDGLSGGPVADAAGLVIGIATAGLSRGYGIVVPAATVSRVVDALIANGRVTRAWLGIGAQPVSVPGTDAASAAAGQTTTGLLITSLAPGGPAEKSGLLIGDVVTRAAGSAASDLHGLRQALAAHVGKVVRLDIVRGGRASELDVAVAEWPAERRCC